MKGVEIYYRGKRKFAIRQARLRDMVDADKECGNPLLWWCEEITPSRQDWICCGVETKRECLDAIEEQMT